MDQQKKGQPQPMAINVPLKEIAEIDMELKLNYANCRKELADTRAALKAEMAKTADLTKRLEKYEGAKDHTFTEKD